MTNATDGVLELVRMVYPEPGEVLTARLEELQQERKKWERALAYTEATGPIVSYFGRPRKKREASERLAAEQIATLTACINDLRVERDALRVFLRTALDYWFGWHTFAFHGDPTLGRGNEGEDQMYRAARKLVEGKRSDG